ncbi:MAG TPA: hypothetical protein VL201_05400 [Patescibacteria group bacterium]|jgi:hypothetical protein|nr:hypothetical protein [Patescibacteria group bacterium]
MLSSKKFLKKVASFLYMGTIFSMEKEVSIPDAAHYKLTRSDHYWYQTNNETHALLVKHSQKSQLRGVVHNPHGKDILSLWINDTTNFNAVKELCESAQITVIDDYLDSNINQRTLLAYSFQPNIIVNDKNRSWYVLYSYKNPYVDQINVALLINSICRNPSEKLSNPFPLQDYGRTACCFPKNTPYNGSLYVFDPNSNTPSNLVIGCIYNQLSNKECNTCHIGMCIRSEKEKDEFKFKLILDDAFFARLLSITVGWQKNALFEALYKNYKMPDTNNILNSKEKNDTTTRIIIDDTQCIHEAQNKFTLSFLVRIYLSRQIDKKPINLSPLYALLEISSLIEENIYLYDQNCSLKLLQISKENRFFDQPIYFNTINKAMPSNRILPIQFDAHAPEQRELLPQLTYKIVKRKEDYFQQGTAEKEVMNAIIMGSPLIVNKEKKSDGSLLPSCLDASIKELFTKAKETLDKSAKDTNVQSIAKELSNIINCLEEICNGLSLELAFQKGLHNSLLETENSLLQIAKKQILAIKDASLDEQIALTRLKTPIIEEIKKFEIQLTNISQKLNGVEKEILTKFEKQLDETFKKLMGTFLTTFEQKIKEWENTKRRMLEDLNQYKQSFEQIKKDGALEAKTLQALADGYKKDLKDFTEMNDKALDIIKTLEFFMSHFDTFKSSVEQKITEHANVLHEKIDVLQKNTAAETVKWNGEITRLRQLIDGQTTKITTLEQTITTLEDFKKKNESFNWRLNFCCLIALLACIKMGVSFMHYGYIT